MLRGMDHAYQLIALAFHDAFVPGTGVNFSLQLAVMLAAIAIGARAGGVGRGAWGLTLTHGDLDARGRE